MAQLSLRIDDDLHRRAKQVATAHGLSLNGYIARVLAVAVDPSADEPAADRIRARLAAAGLLEAAAPPTRARTPEEDDRFDAALSRSGGGTAASALIRQERDGGW